MSEAQQFLSRFLEQEARHVAALLSKAEVAGIRCDYDLGSLEPLAAWLGPKLHIQQMEPDSDVPNWIRSTESYQRGHLSLAEQSAIELLRYSFYFGESFVRTYSQLAWGIGAEEFAQAINPL